MDFLSFDDVELSDVIARIPRKGRDRMQFGIIELNFDGIIMAYNMGEAKVAGRSAADMIGRNFFTEMAPCTKTPEFYGRFKAGVASGTFSVRFDYLFDFESEPRAVRVSMMSSKIDGSDRVLLLIRILPPEDRARAEEQHQRLAEVEQSRKAREQAAALRAMENTDAAAKPYAAAIQSAIASAPSVAPPEPVKIDLPQVSSPAPVIPQPVAQPTAPQQQAVSSTPKSFAKLAVLTPRRLDDIANGRQVFELDPVILAQTQHSVLALDKAIAEGIPIYGITSGFGPLLDEPAMDDASEHQRSLLRHLAAGVGKPFSVVQTRAAMAARLQTLLQGHSGASEKVIFALKLMLDQNITPVVPQIGTVGASGDLTPLAHLALGLCGEGDVVFNRQQRSASSVFTERRIVAPVLTRRDALALVNGCSFSTAIAALNGARARRLLRWNMLCLAAYSQVLCAHDQALAPILATLRPHLGQNLVREELARLHAGNSRTKAQPDVGMPPQDPYTLRCQTQLFGAVLDALEHHDATVEIELNSVSDNPIIDLANGAIVHGGNFFGQHVGLVSDYLRMSIVQWAQWCERAMARLVDPSLNGQSLPPQLRGKPGHSGFMGVQVTATALLAELKCSALAASVQGVSTNANNQDIVPMATLAARQTSDSLDLLANLQAILLLALCQAIDNLAPRRERPFSPAVHALHARVREHIPALSADRSMTHDIHLITAMLNNREPSENLRIVYF